MRCDNVREVLVEYKDNSSEVQCMISIVKTLFIRLATFLVLLTSLLTIGVLLENFVNLQYINAANQLFVMIPVISLLYVIPEFFYLFNKNYIHKVFCIRLTLYTLSLYFFIAILSIVQNFSYSFRHINQLIFNLYGVFTILLFFQTPRSFLKKHLPDGKQND